MSLRSLPIFSISHYPLANQTQNNINLLDHHILKYSKTSKKKRPTTPMMSSRSVLSLYPCSKYLIAHYPTTLRTTIICLIIIYSFTLIKNGWWAKNGSLNIDTAWAAEKDVGLNEVGSHHQLTRDEHDFRKIAKKIIKKWPKKLMTTPTMPWAAQKDVGLTGWQCLTTTALSAAQRKSFPAIFVLLLLVKMIKEDQGRATR